MDKARARRVLPGLREALHSKSRSERRRRLAISSVLKTSTLNCSRRFVLFSLCCICSSGYTLLLLLTYLLPSGLSDSINVLGQTMYRYILYFMGLRGYKEWKMEVCRVLRPFYEERAFSTPSLEHPSMRFQIGATPSSSQPTCSPLSFKMKYSRPGVCTTAKAG